MLKIDYLNILNSPPMVHFKNSYDSTGIKRKSYLCELNSNYSSRFFLIKGGKATFYFNNKKGEKETIITRKNDMVYIPYNAEYYCVWENIDEAKYISIEFYLYDENKNLLVLNENITILLNDSNNIYEDLFQKINNYYLDEHSGNLFKCISVFYDILRHMTLSNSEKKYNEKYDSIYKAIIFLENNYKKDFKITSLAKMSNMCETTFRKTFKEQVGMSPVEYKNHLKLKKASELLQNDMLSVSYISETIGIDDIHYFCRIFRKKYGMSPMQYRNSVGDKLNRTVKNGQ